MWVRNREIPAMALGHSMTTVPATTAMHYRIGGIAETFMSMKDTQFPIDQGIQSPVLHDLGKWGPILGMGRLISPAHFREQICTDLGRRRQEQAGSLFCLWICCRHWLDRAKP
jgi:hypothetical protein